MIFGPTGFVDRRSGDETSSVRNAAATFTVAFRPMTLDLSHEALCGQQFFVYECNCSHRLFPWEWRVIAGNQSHVACAQWPATSKASQIGPQCPR
jgi:hypothetical protein